MAQPPDTCDDCADCQLEENWTPCCAACHCCPAELRCDKCRWLAATNTN